MTTILPHLGICLNAPVIAGLLVFLSIQTLQAAHNTSQAKLDINKSNTGIIDQTSTRQFELNINDTDVSFTVIQASEHNKTSENIILWLPSEHGLPDSVLPIAKSVVQHNPRTEVWLADILSSLFLNVQASSINKVSNDFLFQLVKQVQRTTKKKIFILSSGKGALVAMRASHYWLQDNISTKQFGGLILLFPNLITKTPEPGTTAQYYPITHAVNVPIFIIQPENSPWRWQLATLQRNLVQADATPYIQIINNVRDRFFFRPDATEAEQKMTQQLASIIQNSISYISTNNIRQYQAPKKLQQTKNDNQNKQVRPVKQLASLRLYTKDPKPAPLNLYNLNGQADSLQHYAGQVVLVNFWASWCPPCVHEMPSMENLYLRHKKLKSPFTILAVNMAEDKATIEQFIQTKVKVSFPILLDLDGKALKQWQVFAFPSSFVIDRHGQIRYALFGSMLWDTPEVIDIIDKLLLEPIAN